MNYKFNLGTINVNIPSEASIELKDISVEVTDFNLKDIPSIIKETRKVFKDIKDMVEADNAAVPAPSFQASEPVEDEEECDCDFHRSLAELGSMEAVHAHLQTLYPDAIVIPTPVGFAIVEDAPKSAGKKAE